jgi:outer membrane murein-binding lipoprotein Lpp
MQQLDSPSPTPPRGLNRKRVALVIALAALSVAVLAGCASREKRPVDPQADDCLRQSQAVTPSQEIAAAEIYVGVPKDTRARLSTVTAQANAFSECMGQHGFTLNQDQLDDELRRFELKRNNNLWGTDPYWAIEIRRQELRRSPAFWQRNAAS